MIGQKGIPAHGGGVEQYVQELSVRLVQHGHDVTAYTRPWYSEKTDTSHRGVSLVSLPSVHTKHLDTITHTFSATLHALMGGYDVIHYHGVGPALLSWIPRIFAPKTKVIVTFHCIDRYHQKWNWLARVVLYFGEWAACRFPHHTITVSRTLTEYCRKEFKKETVYIPNGVSESAQAAGQTPLVRFGVEKNKYIIMISRLVPHKGAHLLIEAFVNLKARYADDPMIQEMKLVIVGGSSYTDSYVAALHERASAYNTIVFTDFQIGDALNSLLTHALVVVHPSMNEGLPTVVLEAMAAKKPVLVSHIPEHLELIHDPRALFAENDAIAIERAVYEFLNLSHEEREDMIRTNFNKVIREYSWEKIVPEIIAVYEDTLTHAVLHPAVL